MRTTTLVQASADIVTIINLKAGDVYQRLEKPAYSTEYTAMYGVVQTVAHNGEDTLITALEIATEYSSTTIKLKVFGTDSDLKLFAVSPDEVATHMQNAFEVASTAVATKERELASARQIAETVNRIWGERSSLTAAETTLAVGR